MDCSQKHLLGTESNMNYYDDEDMGGIDPMMIGGMGPLGHYSNNNASFNMMGGYMNQQPVTPPVENETISNVYLPLPDLNSQMGYAAPYQDFTRAGPSGINQGQGQFTYNQYEQLAQGIVISTPNTAGTGFGLESPNDYGGIKLEFDENELFNTSGLTSSQESSTEGGFRVPVLTNFPGKYDFLVEPFEKSGKKCLLWKEANKIFCSNETEIMFSISINDFAKAPLKDLTVETMLVYSSNEYIMEPIVRCVTDIQIERTKKNGMESDLYIRVLRSSCPKAVYGTKNNDRHFISEPLEKPQPGETSILRNYSFMCVNSCKLGMRKRAACILFYLKEKGKEVGRVCYNIKICKCPTRDWKEEDKKKAQGGKRKKSSSPKVEKLDSDDVAKAAKQRRLSPLGSPELGVGTSRGMARVSDESPLDKKCSQDTDEEVLSQESIGSINIQQRVVSDMKLVMAHRKNPDVVCNQIANVAWNQYKGFRKTVKFMRNHILKDDAGQAEAEAEGDGEEFPEVSEQFKSSLAVTPP